MKLKTTVSCLMALTCSITALAKGAMDSLEVEPTPVHRFYIGNALDGGIFSTATMTRRGYSGNTMGTLRFSYILNIGVTFNYDFCKHIGVYTGADIKNIGYIENENGFTIKRRTYNFGIPVGVRIGNIQDRNFFFLGADLEVPFNYKEKVFTDRTHKDEKFNEWFSNRTPLFMPGIYAGFSVHPGITFKVEYYLNNFLNPDYEDGGVKIYDGYDIHLILVSIGADLHYKTHTYKKKFHFRKS